MDYYWQCQLPRKKVLPTTKALCNLQAYSFQNFMIQYYDFILRKEVKICSILIYTCLMFTPFLREPKQFKTQWGLSFLMYTPPNNLTQTKFDNILILWWKNFILIRIDLLCSPFYYKVKWSISLIFLKTNFRAEFDRWKENKDCYDLYFHFKYFLPRLYLTARNNTRETCEDKQWTFVFRTA
jgi:hypothetical protein